MQPENQFNIFDYFESETDPLYQMLEKLEIDQPVQFGPYHVVLNSNQIYEIWNDEVHEGKGTLEKCYRFISDNINNDISFIKS